ncbi:MAG: acetylglutamate kinase [Myxococcota bacterium]|jgi:acetylglutamate kinase|nr:acetylglutamate kinase [Myxococcota bacterium]
MSKLTREERAQVLEEALPYFQRYRKRTIVLKYGGHAMVDRNLKEAFARDLVLLEQARINPVVVHGGGPQIGKMLKNLGIESQFHGGMRITDEQTMDVVEMVLAGQVNKEIVARIGRHGGRAVGLTGRDAGLLKARKMEAQPSDHSPELIDLGRVGTVDSVDVTILETLKKSEIIPVVAPVGYGPGGTALNINADLVAQQLAIELSAERLLLMTDVDGVQDKNGELIRHIDVSQIEGLIADGTISGGMIPKVRGAVEAVHGGVGKVTIMNGTVPHAILLELFTDEGVGTEISKEQSA